MSERKKELSKLCLAGFIFTVLPLALISLCFFFQRGFYVEKVLPAGLILSPLLGLILSIAGLVTAGRKGKGGKAFGIAGAVIPGIGITVVASILIYVLAANASTTSRLQKNEMYSLGRMGETLNTEYDVSPYRIPEGYEFNQLNITVSKAELETYAGSKLQTISKKSDKSIKGVFQDYNFLIVRSDCIDEWLDNNCPRGIQYYNGNASVEYGDYWEFAAIRSYPLAVYKDPSDKYIIITNCDDHKIIAEFFEGIGAAVPIETTVETVEETVEEPRSPEFFDNYEQVVFLRDNINEDMSLLEIIDVVDESCKDTRDKDMYTLEFGTFNYSTYDHYADEYVDMGPYYCFCMERLFWAEDGRTYKLYVSVLYETNSTNQDYKHVEMHEMDVKGDFFDYVRKSYPYNYAKTEKIAKIDIYMIEF